MEKATFAAGCFWGVEETFSKLPGVISTQVGYTGGHFKNPTYEEVCKGDTGHAEAVEVEFDPEKISFEELLNIFWNSHNPTTLNRQGLDVGKQYRSAIFFHDSKQQSLAQASKKAAQASGQFKHDIVTEITQAATFFRAEEYHQKYFIKNPGHCKI